MSLRRSIARIVTPPLIAGLLAIHLDGCSESYSGSTAIADPRGTNDPPLVRIRSGSTIEITRHDGVVMRGRFLGTAGMTPEEYARRREAVLRTLDPRDAQEFPAPGGTLEIQPNSGPPDTVTFESFELHGVEVRRDSEWVTVPLEQIREVRAGHWVRDRDGLIRDAIAGRIPISTVIRLGVAEGEVRVPVDQVAQIGEVTPGGGSGDAAAVGVLVGATAVVLLVVVLAASAKPSCGSIDLPPGWFTDGFH